MMVVQATKKMRAEPKKAITILVAAKVYETLAKMAADRGMATGAYALLLFHAAFTARHGETGDADLDVTVGRVALLWGAKLDTSEIATRVGISESLVCRIVDAWRQELRG